MVSSGVQFRDRKRFRTPTATGLRDQKSWTQTFQSFHVDRDQKIETEKYVGL